MMNGENRYLADNTTLNKHRKTTSEAYTRELPLLANHALLHHHHSLPCSANARWYGHPLPPFQRYCKPSNERQANTSTTPSLRTPNSP